MTAEHMLVLSRSLGAAPRYLAKIAREMADQVIEAIAGAAEEVHPHMDPSQKVLAGRLVQFIRKNADQMRKRLF